MYNKQYSDWLSELSRHPSFTACINLSEKLEIERYDMELAFAALSFAEYHELYAKTDRTPGPEQRHLAESRAEQIAVAA